MAQVRPHGGGAEKTAKMKGDIKMNLLSLLTKALMSDASVNSISQKSGVSSSLIKKLLPLALPLILKSLTKNSSSASGASSLFSALAQHKNNRAIPDQIAEADAEDGAKILGHIFGGDMDSIMGGLAQQSGLESSQVNSVLDNIAPALMSGLSAATTAGAASGVQSGSSGVDMSDLLSIFGGAMGSGSSGSAAESLTADMLSGLFTGSAPQKPKPSGLMGMLGGLLGGGKKEEDTSAFDGSSLLSALMKLQ